MPRETDTWGTFLAMTKGAGVTVMGVLNVLHYVGKSHTRKNILTHICQ